MRTKQFGPELRQTMIVGKLFWLDGYMYKCIGSYANCATIQQTRHPFLAKTYNWQEIAKMMAEKRLTPVREEDKSKKAKEQRNHEQQQTENH